jgi:hypothetical protein
VAAHLWGGTVVIDDSGVLHYHRKGGDRRYAWGPVVLGRYLPKSRTVLLNGDGFTDRHATDWQTNLRNEVRRQVHANPDSKYVRNVAIVPFAALEAAGVTVDTFRPIHVVQDENEQVFRRLPHVTKSELEPIGVHQEKDARWLWQGSVEGRQYQYTEFGVYGYVNTRTGEKTNDRDVYGGWPRSELKWQVVAHRETNQSWTARQAVGGWAWVRSLPTQEAFAALVQERVTANISSLRTGRPLNVGPLPEEPGMYMIEDIHHLGACLFSAESVDGGRHKFLSAFDEAEPQQMYFLAQLPDGSGAKTYGEALLALAPPIVHQARLEGRNVFRQGDVFAIETTMSDGEVYALAKTRVRRNVVMYADTVHQMVAVINGTGTEPTVRAGELREKVECPCKCGHKRWIGWGPKAKRALSIYRTGHTADEVVVSAKGTTYVRGQMYHDPGLEDPGRREEHQSVVLGSGKWCIAVRNTVPRQSARRARQQAEATTREETPV